MLAQRLLIDLMERNIWTNWVGLGRGGGERACLLSNNPSLNPAEANRFFQKKCLKSTKKYKKRPGLDTFRQM